MEEVSLNWPLEGMLEPLRPLTPEAVRDDGLNSCSLNVDQLSRYAKAGKLLDHLDELSKNTEETDPFDWFSGEKSINIPIFETIQPLTQQEIQYSEKPTQIYNFHFDSPEYEPTFASPNYKIDCLDDAELTCTSSATSCDLLLLNDAVVPATPESSETNGDLPKEEVLTPPDSPLKHDDIITPPDSPKDEIMKLFEEIGPAEWDKFAFETHSEDADSIADVDPENSLEMDEFSDCDASSPYVEEQELSSDDSDYTPPCKQRKSSNRRTATTVQPKKRKPHARKPQDDRKLRKKEQNKNAATRYRLKKKQEMEKSKSEELVLKKKNKQLHRQLADISREIKCLKSLMRDVYRKKGIIK